MKRFALFALVSLALAAAASAQNKPLTKVVYTLTTKDVSVGLSAHTSLPLTLGYWKAEGLDVEVTTLDGSTAGLQQLAAGNIQFATVGPEVAMIAREKGVKVKSFYVVSGVTISASSSRATAQSRVWATCGASRSASRRSVRGRCRSPRRCWHRAGLIPTRT